MQPLADRTRFLANRLLSRFDANRSWEVTRAPAGLPVRNITVMGPENITLALGDYVLCDGYADIASTGSHNNYARVLVTDPNGQGNTVGLRYRNTDGALYVTAWWRCQVPGVHAFALQIGDDNVTGAISTATGTGQYLRLMTFAAPPPLP
jgi:hypothetical protein